MKLPSILALIVILFLSLSVVSADEIVQDVTNTSDSVIDDSIGISDSYNNLASNFDDSISDDSSNILNSNLSSDEENIELIEENQDLDDEITLNDLKDSKLSSSSVSDSQEIIISNTEPITIDSSNYSQYFDATNGDYSIVSETYYLPNGDSEISDQFGNTYPCTLYQEYRVRTGLPRFRARCNLPKHRKRSFSVLKEPFYRFPKVP